MELVYKETGLPVNTGDVVTLSGGQVVEVTYFRKPHKPESQGKVSVARDKDDCGMEYYVNVIGAHWINREDQ